MLSLLYLACDLVSENMSDSTKKWEKIYFIFSAFISWKAFLSQHISCTQIYFSICTKHIVSLPSMSLWNLKLGTLTGRKGF